MGIIKNNKDLPQHNQAEIEKFIEKDIPSGKPYFCFLKNNDGKLHILSNIYDSNNLKLVSEEFIGLIKAWLENGT